MQHVRTMAVILAAGVALAACSTNGDEGGQSDDRADRAPIVIDTDMGSDDVMAILYLLRRPDVDVRAITVSGTGLAHCGPGVHTVLGLLKVARAPDVPVACGSEAPLGGSNAFPEEWRAAADEAYGLTLPATDRQPSEADAVSVLSSAIRGADGVTLITLGPLTNIAEAFTAEPELAQDVTAIVSMGGALLAGGNVEANPEAEWNFHADPRAVDVVLRSGAPITLVPLDATNSVPITAYFVDALRGHHLTPEADMVLALLEGNPMLVEPGNFFWDPLTAVLALDGSPATLEDHRVVVLQGSPDVDGELVLSSSGIEVRAAMSADPLAFETEYLNTLNGDEAIARTRPDPDLTFTLSPTGCAGDMPTSLPAGTVDVKVQNPLNVGGAAILATTTGGHAIDELVSFVERLEGPQETRPPKWIASEAFTDAPAGGSTLAPWDLAPGTHAVVCGIENGVVAVAGTFEVTG